MRWMLSSPRRASGVGKHLLLLHLIGRKSGRALTLPVAYRRLPDGRLLVLTSSTWRVNLRGRPDVDVTLLGRRQPARAELVEDEEAVAGVYEGLIATEGHGSATRRMGIRVNVDREPTHEELVEAARGDRLSAIYLLLAATAQ